MVKIVKKISIENLFKLCEVDNDIYWKKQKGKYDIKINTPQGFKNIKGYVKKNNLKTFEVNIDGKIVKGAATHKVKINDKWKKLKEFKNKKFIGINDLYDIAVSDPHEFYTTNGLIHHNTTLAKALCKDLQADYKYINVSSESGIDTLRTKIEKFASTKSFTGGQKVVIMDEFDGASKQLQQGMRAAIEEFHKVCRFIFTCNYITQIIQPLKSRCQEFDMNYMDNQSVKELKPAILDRITKILQHKNIMYDESVIQKLIDTEYPDMRKIIQLCQQYSNIKGEIDTDIFNFGKLDDDFYDLLLKKKFGKARQYVIEKNYDYTEMYSNLYREFVPRLDDAVQPQAILVLAQFQQWHIGVVDAELNFAACLIELINTY